MNLRISFLLITLYLISAINFNACRQAETNEEASLWITSADKSALFEKQPDKVAFSSGKEGLMETGVSTITLDSDRTYQQMDGFGYTLTGGSTLWLSRMSDDARSQLLRELFTTEEGGIGVSYLRVSIGSSDLDPYVFSYNELPEGETDPEMEHFSLDPDREYLIPMLQEIIEIAPDIPILGSPWSPPTWMKDNNDSIGGSLLPEFYDAYALYFVRYIEEMHNEGITIDAITVQNEPLHPGNNPSMLMKADEQADFIKNHLGPAFDRHDIDTKIIIYDHNLDRIDYPLEVLSDPEAAKYVDGTAFHLYGGEIESMSKIQEQYPDKHLYFTEQWVGAQSDFRENLPWHMQNLMIGAPRNWSRNVLQWNLVSSPDLTPHTNGGCTECLGAITIDGDEVTRNDAYYFIAHASKFVRPGSVRIYSSKVEELPNVAFRRPDGGKVLLLYNPAEAKTHFQIISEGQYAVAAIPAESAGTVVWGTD